MVVKATNWLDTRKTFLSRLVQFSSVKTENWSTNVSAWTQHWRQAGWLHLITNQSNQCWCIAGSSESRISFKSNLKQEIRRGPLTLTVFVMTYLVLNGSLWSGGSFAYLNLDTFRWHYRRKKSSSWENTQQNMFVTLSTYYLWLNWWNIISLCYGRHMKW